MRTDPLSAQEMEAACSEFFPLFEIVRKQMPAEATTEDTLKVMETVCKLAHKLREEEKERFGFNKKDQSA